MADLAQGYTADVMLMPGDSVRVSTVGQATVRSAYGAPAGTTTLNANTQTFGPYGVPAKLTITAVSGTANYVQPTQVPVTYDPSTGIVNSPGAVSGAGNPLAPGQPQNVRALARNGAVVVYWEASTTGTPDSYTITASTGATLTVAATGRAQSATLAGLTNGVAVTVSVKAANSAGTSIASASSNSVTPTSLPSTTLPVTDGLLAWYDTILQPSLPANGAELSSWTDLSGNGFNLTRAGGAGTGGTVVASWSNSNPAIQLNGSTQYYTAAGLILGAYGPNQTVLVVGDVQSNAGAGRMVSNETTAVINADAVFYLGFTGTGPTTPSVKSGYPSPVSAPTVVLSTPFDAIVTNPGQLYINGVAVATPIDPVTRTATGTLSVGAQNGGINASTLACRIATVIVFNRVLSSAEISAMRTFLATRR